MSDLASFNNSIVEMGEVVPKILKPNNKRDIIFNRCKKV